ncbi:DUF2017 domain-containing protein [soil metagenome]
MKRAPSGTLGVHLDEVEADLLRRLTSEMRALLRADPAGDPVTRRLFPDAYEDERASNEYRELIGDDLRAAKVSALDIVHTDLGVKGAANLELSQEGVGAWLTTLTDLRLAIGTRLDVDERAMQEELELDDPAEATAMFALHWLGWVQESMLEAELDTSGEDHDAAQG